MQMTFKYGLITLGLMMSSSVFSAVTISTPEEIVILAVNDQEVNAGLLRTKKMILKLMQAIPQLACVTSNILSI